MAAKLQLNQLLTDDKGNLFTVQRNPEAKRRCFQVVMACTVEYTTSGFYSRTIKRPLKAFQVADFMGDTCDGLTEVQAAELIKRWNLQPEPIAPHNEPAYFALLTEANRLSLPQNYREDLTHYDREMLLRPGAPIDFLWILRTSGTHLFRLDTFSNTSGNRPTDLVTSMKGFGDTEMHWYHYCDNRLREITYEKALVLAQDAVTAADAAEREARRGR